LAAGATLPEFERILGDLDLLEEPLGGLAGVLRRRGGGAAQELVDPQGEAGVSGLPGPVFEAPAFGAEGLEPLRVRGGGRMARPDQNAGRRRNEGGEAERRGPDVALEAPE